MTQPLPPALAPTPLTRAFLDSIGAAFNSRDVERIVSFFHDDCIFWLALGPEYTGRPIVGKEAVRKLLTERFKNIPDMHWKRLEEFVVGENRGVTVWRVTGRSADGTVLDYKGCDLYEFKDRLIWRKDTYWKIVRPD
ncbi:MAG: nuclear transport factor 2 family protein [Alphaproteobacteria bacterium]|nr:nuclear transport factor 2 family protein [Alphaproteobacteria bacterium]